MSRVVAITGGARGIGRATARALAGKGYRVAIGDIETDLAERTAEELGVLGLGLDVTDRDSFAAFLDEAEERLGPLDVLVNNAGVMPIGRLEDEDDAVTRRLVEINLHGVITGCKLALERMRPRDRGHIVNVASQAGKAGFPGLATYCATKFAVIGLTESLRGELRETGIEVSCVMPAVVSTELSAGMPLGRALKAVAPEDVADAIAEALEAPRHDVHVPKSVGVIGAVLSPLPRRAREAVGRAMGADRVALDADPIARAAYEERARGSERVS